MCVAPHDSLDYLLNKRSFRSMRRSGELKKMSGGQFKRHTQSIGASLAWQGAPVHADDPLSLGHQVSESSRHAGRRAKEGRTP